MALHHLITDCEKKSFYKKIYNGLNYNGCFFNADVILASNDLLQNKYIIKWIDFMKKNVSQEEIENKWIPKYKEEDKPAILLDQIKWLEEIGFKIFFDIFFSQMHSQNHPISSGSKIHFLT